MGEVGEVVQCWLMRSRSVEPVHERIHCIAYDCVHMTVSVRLYHVCTDDSLSHWCVTSQKYASSDTSHREQIVSA